MAKKTGTPGTNPEEAAGATPEVKVETPKYPAEWLERVGGFAAAVGLTIEAVTEKLTQAAGEPSEETLAILADPSAAPDADLKGIFADLNIPSFKLNKYLVKLRGEKASTPVATERSSESRFVPSFLPIPPDNTSFISMLKTDGELKIGKIEVICGAKAIIASAAGLYDFQERLLDKMETFAENQNLVCGKEYFTIKKILSRRNYTEIFAAFDDAKSEFVTEKKKKLFIAKFNEFMWPALKSFQDQVDGWEKTWTATSNNPGMLQQVILASRGVEIPGIFNSHPDTSAILSSAEEVINTINKVFAGLGKFAARVMAYDATQIAEVLDKPEILAQTGYATKDIMLKELGIAVGADMVRIERSISQYLLSVMTLPEITPDNEASYLQALSNLGRTIDWDKLAGRGIAGRKLTA